MEQKHIERNNLLIESWWEVNENIASLNSSTHGGPDFNTRQRLIDKREAIRNKINEDTHYAGEIFPGL